MIFHGPYPDVAIPEVSLTDFIFHSANGIQDKPALIDGPTGRALFGNDDPGDEPDGGDSWDASTGASGRP